MNRSEEVFSNGGKWSALGWDSSTSGHNTGRDTTTGWGPYDAFSTVNGAYWTPTSFSDKAGDAAAVTMQTSPGGAERYVALWLDMSAPATAKTGYQLRWTYTSPNTYGVVLAKYSAGTQTVLASSPAVTIPNGATLALSDTGGTVTAWQSSGGSLASILSAADTSFSGGYAGIEGSGNISRSTNFQAGNLGTMAAPPDTSISSGPKGVVVPNFSFGFSATEPGSSFECALDAGGFGACSSPKSYQGVAEGAHAFQVRAVGVGGKDPTPAERGFSVVTTAKATAKTTLLDNLERSEVPLATGKWTKTQWAAAIGGAWMGSYRGYGSSSGLAGAYWNPATFSDSESTVLAAATVGTGSVPAGQYSALLLDMPNPAAARSGYEARFLGTGLATNYTVELAKWVAGTRTVLASTTGFSLPVGTTIVLTETAGGPLTLWTGTSGFTALLSANDSTYTSGYAGLEVNGGAGTLYNFRAGRIDLEAPNTTIQTGPTGTVQPGPATFTFTSSESGSSFACSLDGAAFAECTSPKTYSSPAGGSHTFRVRATDAVGNVDETPAERAFQVASPPTATTEAASGVKANEATLRGGVDPEAQATTYQFEYGTTTSYGSKAPASAKAIGSGTSVVEVSEPITGLQVGTTYHFRVVATSATGTVQGQDRTFTTVSAPQATTDVATQLSATEATLNAIVNPRGGSTTYQFEYGTTTSYGKKVPAAPKSVGSGLSEVTSSEKVIGLLEGSKYHFRVVAMNEAGTTFGADEAFETPLLPNVTTGSASDVNANEAVLMGTVDPNNEDTTYQFEYGTTTSYGTTLPTSEEVEGGNAPVEAEEGVGFLQPETTYHYRLVATSAAGTVPGSDRTVTTSAREMTTQQEAQLVQAEASGVPVPSGFVNMMWNGEFERMGTKGWMEMIRGSGSKMLRIPVGGRSPLMDEIFRLASYRDITILPGVGGGGPMEKENPEGKRPTWVNGVKTAVAAYGRNGSFWKDNPQVPNHAPLWWEVWNEENYGKNGDFDEIVKPAVFGDLLEETAVGIHEVDSGAQILLGGLLTVGKYKGEDGEVHHKTVGEFIRQMGHHGFYDAVSLHPYAFKAKDGEAPSSTSPSEIEYVRNAIRSNIQEARAALDEKGGVNKKLWITEIGWPVKDTYYNGKGDGLHVPVNEETQRDLLNSTLNMIKARSGTGPDEYSIKNVFYYNVQDFFKRLDDKGSTCSIWDCHSGLREEYKPHEQAHYRKAWYALQKQAGFTGTFPKNPKNQHKSLNRKAKRATITSIINPYGSPTDYWVKWGPGTGTSYGNFTTAQSVGTPEEGDVDQNVTVTGLQPLSTYHYKVVAENDNGEKTETEDVSFTTPPSTSTSADVTRVLHGQPGYVWVSGWVKEGYIEGPESGPGLDNVNVHVNFVRNGETKSVNAVAHNGFYQSGYVQLGKGHWEVRSVFPGGGEWDESKSGYKEFDIRDGVQIIAKHSGGCMDVNGASTANGTAIMHGGCGNPAQNQNQVFSLVPQGDGSMLQIIARHSGKCVDVVGASGSDGAGLQQNTCMGAGQTNQLFQEAWWGETPYTSYVAKHSGKCLDVQGGATGWAPFVQWACNETFHQRFQLQPVESAPIPTEVFLTIDQALHGSPGMVSFHGHLLAGAYPMTNRVVHVEFDNADTAGWDTQGGDVALAVNSEGYYEYRDWGINPGRYLVRARFVGNSEFGEGLTIAQSQTIKRGYQIINRYSNQCLSLSENKNVNGQAFIQWGCGAPVNGNGQIFSFWPRGSGWYDIRTNGTNRCVDVAGANPNNGAFVQLWDCLGAGQYNQHWDREPISGQPGWYALIARHSNRCMDDLGWSTNQGARIGQWDCLWGGNQQWELRGVIDP